MYLNVYGFRYPAGLGFFLTYSLCCMHSWTSEWRIKLENRKGFDLDLSELGLLQVTAMKLPLEKKNYFT